MEHDEVEPTNNGQEDIMALLNKAILSEQEFVDQGEVEQVDVDVMLEAKRLLESAKDPNERKLRELLVKRAFRLGKIYR